MDLRVVHLRKILPISQMLDVPGPPHRLYISGIPADEVSDVEINGDRGYTWETTGARVIAVELPRLFRVQTVAVLGRELGDAKSAECYLGFTTFPSFTKGLQKLAQEYLRVFLTTPGSDPYSTRRGGGGQEILQRETAAEGIYSSAMAVAVRETTKQIITRQAADMALPRDERLLSARLLRVTAFPDRTGYTADIEIQSQSGTSARLNVNSLDS